MLGQVTSIILPKDAIRATDAAGAIGTKTVVCGDLVGVRLPSTNKEPTRLDLDLAFPRQPISLTVPKDTIGDFPEFFKRLFEQRFLCVRGKIERVNNAVELKLSAPNQVVGLGPIPKNLKFPTNVPRCNAPGISWPDLTSHPDPKYTSWAMKAKITGNVFIDVVVRVDGRVGEMQITKSLDPLLGLDDEALAAVSKWKFKPAMSGGAPVACIATAELTFNLH